MQKKYLIMLTLLVVVIASIMSVSAYVVNTNLNAGATVFIGEQGLNISGAIPASDVSYGLGWWAPGADLITSSPSGNFQIPNINSVDISPSVFNGFLGNWYVKAPIPYLCFNVQDPTLSLDIVDLTQGSQTVNGATVVQGDVLGFKINNNMYSVYSNQRKPSSTVMPRQGWADIKVRNNQGSTLVALSNTNGVSTSLSGLVVDNSPWIWGTLSNGWSTNAANGGQYMYPTGSYTAYVESQLNGMKDNYKNSAGADFTGRTVSTTQFMTISSGNLVMDSNVDTVPQSRSFSVTITGNPNEVYHLWVKGTSGMSGSYDNLPPMIMPYQSGVTQEVYGNDYASTRDIAAVHPDWSLGYIYQNGNVVNGVPSMVFNDVSANNYTNWGSACAANVQLSSSGTRTVAFTTSAGTKPQKYTIHIEQKFDTQYKSAETDITVTKGSMLITTAGDQNHYIGQNIKLSGLNTVSYKTYLFITGPNLNVNGAQINSGNPRVDSVVIGDPNTYPDVPVNGDNTWTWTWGTANIALDSGTYTVWATSQMADASTGGLSNVSYSTTTVNLRKPFISAISSASNIAQGDKLLVRGVAEGSPAQGVQIWVLGKNYFTVNTQSVGSDSYFTYEFAGAITSGMFPGQYFVVVQHPMQNGLFDIDYDPATGRVYNKQLGLGTSIFTLTGAGSLQGSDAAEALINSITDANIDDMYTKFQFTIDTPYIRVQPITYKQVGTKFQIIADTNLAPDDDVMVEVYSSSFAPTQKSGNGEFSGATGNVKVVRGVGNVNQIISDLDTTTFKPDDYIVTETAVLLNTVGTGYFSVGIAPPKPVVNTNVTVTNTSLNIITIPPTPTPVRTANVTTTAPEPSPGFETVFALIGLIVAGIVIATRKQ